MKPPNCHLCGREVSGPYSGRPAEANTSGLVQFVDYLSLPEGICGHPHGLEWFCSDHFAAAEALSDRSVEEALAEMRRAFRVPLPTRPAPAGDRFGLLRRLRALGSKKPGA